MSQLVTIHDIFAVLVDAISTLLQPLVDVIGIIAESFDGLVVIMKKHYRFVNKEGRSGMDVVPYNKSGLDALLSIIKTPESCLEMLLLAIELKKEDILRWKDEPEKLGKGKDDLEYFLAQLSILTYAKDEKDPFFTVKLQNSEFEIVL